MEKLKKLWILRLRTLLVEIDGIFGWVEFVGGRSGRKLYIEEEHSDHESEGYDLLHIL